MSSPGLKTRSCVLALCFGLAFNLTGCGQKGALYLPDKAQTVVRKTSPAATPATPATAVPATASPAPGSPASAAAELAPGETPPGAPPDKAPPNTTDPDKDKISPKPVQ